MKIRYENSKKIVSYDVPHKRHPLVTRNTFLAWLVLIVLIITLLKNIFGV